MKRMIVSLACALIAPLAFAQTSTTTTDTTRTNPATGTTTETTTTYSSGTMTTYRRSHGRRSRTAPRKARRGGGATIRCPSRGCARAAKGNGL